MDEGTLTAPANFERGKESGEMRCAVVNNSESVVV